MSRPIAHRRRAKRSITAIVMLMAAGCGLLQEPQPAPLEGTFVLTSVDGEPLPQITSFEQENRELRVVADTFAFAADGRGSWRHTAILRHLPSGPEHVQRGNAYFAHDRSGADVTLTGFGCGPACDMISMTMRFVTRDNDTIERTLESGVWRYQRIATP